MKLRKALGKSVLEYGRATRAAFGMRPTAADTGFQYWWVKLDAGSKNCELISSMNWTRYKQDRV